MDADRPAQAASADVDGPVAGDVTSPARHGEFRLDRELPAPRAEVFRAFGDPETRRRWFRVPGRSATMEHALDFRVGGTEAAGNVFVSGTVEERLAYRSRFLDIVPDARIVLAYDIEVDGVRRWISLVTVELADAPAGTRLTWTEQYTWLVPTGDGSDDVPHLRGGTGLLLNGLSALFRAG
jgi:uncharacterized protein YndB with AHSA1/START domain